MFDNNFFYNSLQLKKIGIQCGENCFVHSSSNITNYNNLIMKNNIRIDAFTNIIAMEKILIESNVHIGAYAMLHANKNKIILKKYSGISAGVQIYTHSDDYLGSNYFGPMSKKFKKVDKGKSALISIGMHSIIGSNSIILPGASIPTGVSIGALSLINRKLKSWSVYSGNPAVYILPRKNNHTK